MLDRLAFSTLGCPGWSLEEIADNAAAMGFSAIELRGVKEDLDVTLIPGFGALAEEAIKGKPLRYCGVNTSIFLSDPSRNAENIKEARRTADLCAELGIPNIRVFGDAFPEGRTKAQTIKAVAEGISEISEICGDKICVLLEVHGEFNRSEVLAQTMESLSAGTNAGLIWDIEHSYRVYGNDIEGFYNVVRPYVRHVHVKDCLIENGKTEARLMGEGGIEVEKIIGMLESGGYQGLYSFEWEKRWRPSIAAPEAAFPAFVNFMRRISADEKHLGNGKAMP
ncbi:MAG: sugar phosphate isomerase/epimerase [Clostridiales bacterium]|jgi:sugar phosphate isomerase/epimerase|nr:sugar phosphate isomerase/epimerase [Clostridiales bacterium]